MIVITGSNCCLLSYCSENPRVNLSQKSWAHNWEKDPGTLSPGSPTTAKWYNSKERHVNHTLDG